MSRLPLLDIGHAELAHLNERGKPFNPKSIAMLAA
jgi:hypothetical protein